MSEETITNGDGALTGEEKAAPASLADLQRKMALTGTVKRLELYGAFIDIGVGVDALIHISQLGKKRVNRIADVLKVGETVQVWVDRVDAGTQQVSVTMIPPVAVDWSDLAVGQTYSGTVTRLENFGAFVDIGAEKEGLVHVSELSHDYVKNPREAVKVGEQVQVKVLAFNKRKRRIDLSIKALQETAEAQQASFVEDSTPDDLAELPTAMEIALRRAMGQEIRAESSRSAAGKGRRRRERLRRQQQEIINRTLTKELK